MLAYGAATATTAIGLGACSSNKPTPRTNPADHVKYRTGFSLFGREGYIIVARDKGFFREHGITVDQILAGSGRPTDTDQLLAGQYDFQTNECTQVIRQMDTGEAKGWVAIGAVHQRTVIALMSLAEEQRIILPRDLAGKIVGYGSPVPRDLFSTYADLNKFQPGDVAKNWVPVQPAALPVALASRRVQAIGQFVTGQPAVAAAAKQAGLSGNVNVWAYGDYIDDLYGNLIGTSVKLVEQKPDLVKRFSQAIFQGVQYAIDNPDEAGRLINAAWRGTPAPVAAAELTVMRPYSAVNGVPVGALNPTRVAQAIALMTSIGAIRQGTVTPDKFADYTIAPKGPAS